MDLNDFKKFLEVRKKFLTEEQMKFFEAFFKGGNIAITSKAGAGKSFVIEILCQYLESRSVPVGRTASTGISALNIGGSTIHSWAFLGYADGDKQSVYRNALRNKKAIARMRATHILVIDEVSMLSADFLDKLDYVLKRVRNNDLPFGSVKCIFSFDFLQLLPVFKNLDQDNGLAFQSRAWEEAKFKIINLKTVMRQDNNSPFVEMLNTLRVGDTSKLGLLKSRENATFPNDGIKPIRLFCKNVDVDSCNKRELDKIQSPSKFFKSIDSGLEHHIKFFDRNCPAPKNLELKIGAQVMLLVNLDVEAGLVNGSMGIVKSFLNQGVEVKFINGVTEIIEPHDWEIKEQNVDEKTEKPKTKIMARRKQLPLKLAFAVSCHKSQGQTFDRAEIDLNEAFGDAMVYVALSRVRSLEGLSIKPFCPSKVKANADCLAFYEELEND